MNNFVLKRLGFSIGKTGASYLKNFKLAHINWELNRQEDRFSKQERLIHSMRNRKQLFEGGF